MVRLADGVAPTNPIIVAIKSTVPESMWDDIVRQRMEWSRPMTAATMGSKPSTQGMTSTTLEFAEIEDEV